MANPKQRPHQHLHKAQNLYADSNKRTSIHGCLRIQTKKQTQSKVKQTETKNILNANQIKDKDERFLLNACHMGVT